MKHYFAVFVTCITVESLVKFARILIFVTHVTVLEWFVTYVTKYQSFVACVTTIFFSKNIIRL